MAETGPSAHPVTFQAAESPTGTGALLTQPLALLAGFVLLYALHASVRLLATSALEVDHAEQALLIQQLKWSYGLRQPPLYSWLLWVLEYVNGVARSNFVMLKYACFLLAGVCWWQTARAMGADRRTAALATLSLLWLYQIVWKLHHGVSHTALLTLACTATLWLVWRLMQQHRRRDYIALGVMLGIGVMSKHGYWAFLLALLIAASGEALLRRRLLAPRMRWSVAALLLVAGPYLLGLLTEGTALASEYQATLHTTTESRSLIGGIASLALAMLGFLSPFWLLALVPLFLAWRRDGQRQQAAPSGPGERLLGRMLLVLCLFLCGMVLLTGARSFLERWMHPFLLWLPLWWTLRSSRLGLLAPGRLTPRLLTGGALLLAVTALLWQLAQDIYGPPWCGKCRPLIDYRALVADLEANGLGHANVLAADEHIGANLLLGLPRTRVQVPQYPQAPTAARPGSPCVVVWSLGSGDAPPAALIEAARQWCPVSPGHDTAERVHTVVTTLAAWRQRYPGWTRHLAAPHADVAFGWAWAELPP